MKSARDTIRDLLVELAPEATPKARQDAERRLLKAVALILVRDGYPLGASSEALGMGRTTLSTWTDRDPEFAAAVADDQQVQRRWLLGKMRAAIEGDTRAAGKALNIASNLAFPELRSSKVEAIVASAPDPGASRKRAVELVNKGKRDEI